MQRTLLISVFYLLSGLGLFLPTSDAFAESWWCRIHTSMKGKTNHYFMHGRDAWESQAQMECNSQNISIARYVQLVFSSGRPGFGATEHSLVDFNVTLWLDMNPWELKTRMDLTGLSIGSYVYYEFKNSQTAISANAWTGSNPAVAKSLLQGSLIIRPIHSTSASLR